MASYFVIGEYRTDSGGRNNFLVHRDLRKSAEGGTRIPTLEEANMLRDEMNNLFGEEIKYFILMDTEN